MRVEIVEEGVERIALFDPIEPGDIQGYSQNEPSLSDIKRPGPTRLRKRQ